MAGALGYTLDDWQHKVLTSEARNLILLAGRQCGKTAVVAMLALHTILTQPNATVLCLSPSLAQSQEVFRRVANMWKDLARPIKADSETTLSVVLQNGARLLSLPGTEGRARGYSADLVICDEAARLDDLTFYAVRPTTAATGGRMVLLSTPFGKRGFYHDIWISGDPDWERHMIRSSECPRIPASFLESERRSMPASVYRAEYECEFGENEQNVFTVEDVEAAFSKDIPPLLFK
jgi:hypothetical protein